jgi:hypothetical protein
MNILTESFDTRGRILFAGENGLVAAMSAPTVFTGQRLRGTLLLSQQARSLSFDAVHLILKGVSAHVLSKFSAY